MPLAYNFNLSKMTMNQWGAESKLSNEEMVLIEDCLVRQNAIIPRNRIRTFGGGIVDTTTNAFVVGMKEYRGENNKRWIILALSVGRKGYPNVTKLYAINVVPNGDDLLWGDEVIQPTENGMSGFGESCCITEYLGKVYVSNGVNRTAIFTGKKWVVSNRQVDIGIVTTWNISTEFVGRLIVANTRLYPNEIAWCDALEPVPEGSDNSFFTGNILLGANEEVRGLFPADAILFVFSNRAIYSLDASLTTLQPLIHDFELFNNNCVKNYERGYALFGYYRGVPGVYFWDGSGNEPILLTRMAQKIINDGYMGSYPKNRFLVWDTKDDFTVDPGNMFYDAGQWLNDNGIMKCQQDPEPYWNRYDGLTSYSISRFEDGDNGIHLGADEQWESISFELTETSGQPKMWLWMQFATDGEMTNDGWASQHMVWISLDGGVNRQPRKQGEGVTYRWTYKLQKEWFIDNTYIYDHWDELKWMRWKVSCRIDHTDNTSVKWVDRVVVRIISDVGLDQPVNPSLIVYDERIYANFDINNENDELEGRTLVIGNESVVSQKLGRVSTVSVLDKFLLIGRKTENPYTRYVWMQSPRDRIQTYLAGDELYLTQVLETGWIDFADGTNPDLTLAKKVLRKIQIYGKSMTWNDAGITVKWINENGDTDWNNAPSNTIWFSSNRNPSNIKSIEIPSAPSNILDAGYRFKIRIEPANIHSQFRIDAIRIEADLWNVGRNNVFSGSVESFGSSGGSVVGNVAGT